MLFTDLVGSTELRARLGEDTADELRRLHDGLLGDAVARHDRTLRQPGRHSGTRKNRMLGRDMDQHQPPPGGGRRSRGARTGRAT